MFLSHFLIPKITEFGSKTLETYRRQTMTYCLLFIRIYARIYEYPHPKTIEKESMVIIVKTYSNLLLGILLGP